MPRNILPQTWYSRANFGGGRTLPFTNFKYTPAQLAAWKTLPFNVSPVATTEQHKTNTSVAYEGEDAFLPKKLDTLKNKITVALDIDETLVKINSYAEGTDQGKFVVWDEHCRIRERPGARDFLHQMNELFEVIVFTNAINEYAYNVMKHYDPENKLGDDFFSKRILSRGHVRYGQNKDLFKAGRPLDKILLIDNREYTFRDQPRNSIHVPDFEGHKEDTCLIDIIPMMKELAKADRVYDVLDPFNAQFVHEEDLAKIKK